MQSGLIRIDSIFEINQAAITVHYIIESRIPYLIRIYIEQSNSPAIATVSIADVKTLIRQGQGSPRRVNDHEKQR